MLRWIAIPAAALGAGCSLLSFDGSPGAGRDAPGPRFWVDLAVLAEPPGRDVVVELEDPRGRVRWTCAQLDAAHGTCGEAARWWSGPGEYRIRAAHVPVRDAPPEVEEAVVVLEGNEEWIAVQLDYALRATALTRTLFEVQVRRPPPLGTRLHAEPHHAEGGATLLVLDNDSSIPVRRRAVRHGPGSYWIVDETSALVVVGPGSSAPMPYAALPCWTGEPVFPSQVLVETDFDDTRPTRVVSHHVVALDPSTPLRPACAP